MLFRELLTSFAFMALFSIGLSKELEDIKQDRLEPLNYWYGSLGEPGYGKEKLSDMLRELVYSTSREDGEMVLKRAPFNAWAGKRTPVIARMEKRAPFSSWAGKRAPFSSWAGKRGSALQLEKFRPASQKIKRSIYEGFGTYSGQRMPQGTGFSAWGGKRDVVLDDSKNRVTRDVKIDETSANFSVYKPVRAAFSAWGGKKK